MSLKDQITEDMKTAMRAKDSARLGTIRLLQAAMKAGPDLPDHPLTAHSGKSFANDHHPC